MSEENVIKVVIQAVSDLEYRELLFNDPGKALEGFELTEEEAGLLHNMKREHFDEAFSELDERVSRAGFNLSLPTSTPNNPFWGQASSSRSADVSMSAGQFVAPNIPGGSVLSAAISGIRQLKDAAGG